MNKKQIAWITFWLGLFWLLGFGISYYCGGLIWFLAWTFSALMICGVIGFISWFFTILDKLSD